MNNDSFKFYEELLSEMHTGRPDLATHNRIMEFFLSELRQHGQQLEQMNGGKARHVPKEPKWVSRNVKYLKWDREIEVTGQLQLTTEQVREAFGEHVDPKFARTNLYAHYRRKYGTDKIMTRTGKTDGTIRISTFK